MGLSLAHNTQNTGVIGVYSNNFVTLIDTSTVNYFELDVSIYNDTVKTVRLTQDDVSTAVIDVNKLMEEAFNSDAVDPSINLIQYSLHARSYHTDDITLYANSDSSNWILNGIRDDYNFYLANTTNKSYLDNYGYAPKFLNDQDLHYLSWDGSLHDNIAERSINELKLYILNGTFRSDVSSGDDSFINDLEIIRYDDTSTSYIYDINSANNEIIEVDIDPYNLNLNVPDLSIFSETSYYSIADASGNSETYKVYLDSTNELNDKYFRIAWINKNSVLNHFNFSYNYNKSLEINKKVYDFMSDGLDQHQKQYLTKAEEIFNISTDYITEDQAKVLESLWVSPSVKTSAFYIKSSDYYKDFIDEKRIWDQYIILDVKNIDIKRQFNSNLINYSVNFVISDKYKIQAY